jgi:hypothetical protein
MPRMLIVDDDVTTFQPMRVLPDDHAVRRLTRRAAALVRGRRLMQCGHEHA